MRRSIFLYSAQFDDDSGLCGFRSCYYLLGTCTWKANALSIFMLSGSLHFYSHFKQLYYIYMKIINFFLYASLNHLKNIQHIFQTTFQQTAHVIHAIFINIPFYSSLTYFHSVSNIEIQSFSSFMLSCVIILVTTQFTQSTQLLIIFP